MDRNSIKVIWNNDGSDMVGPACARGTWPRPVESAQQFIDTLMRFLEGTEVDAIFYNGHTNEPDWEHPSKNIEVLGPNPLSHVVDFAHNNGMEFFYSIRMNDTHASYFPPNISYWPPFRLKHPELLLANATRKEFENKYMPWVMRFINLEEERARKGDVASNVLGDQSELRRRVIEEHPLKDVINRRGLFSRDLWSWTAYNYAYPEVRARYLDVVEGACQRYDLEGVELDWIRMPIFFKLGEERRNIPIMNDFVRQVRQCLDHYGEKRGRPILLATRVPDTVDLSLSVGLDPESWAREGWVNLFMAGSGLMPFSVPMADWVQLGHQHGIRVYGCIDRILPIFRTGRPKFDVRDPDIIDDLPSNYDAVHAASNRFWKAGVDGIYFYDWHTHHGPTDPQEYGTLPKVGAPRPLECANKLYQIDPDFPVRPGQGALANACLPGQVPRAFITQSGPATARFSLDIADDPDAVASVTLLTQWKQDMDPKSIIWQFNNRLLSASSVRDSGKEWLDIKTGLPPEPGADLTWLSWTELDVPKSFLIKGLNTLQVTVQPTEQDNSGDPVELLQIRVSIMCSSSLH